MATKLRNIDTAQLYTKREYMVNTAMNDYGLPRSLAEHILFTNGMSPMRIMRITSNDDWEHYIDNLTPAYVYRIIRNEFRMDCGWINLKSYKMPSRKSQKKCRFYFETEPGMWSQIVVSDQEGKEERNIVWLKERDDAKAVHLLAQSLLVKIEDAKAKVDKLETMMNMVLDWTPEEV